MVGKKTGLEPTAEVKAGKLSHFAIAGEDKKWFWAEATIDGAQFFSPRTAATAL